MQSVALQDILLYSVYFRILLKRGQMPSAKIQGGRRLIQIQGANSIAKVGKGGG